MQLTLTAILILILIVSVVDFVRTGAALRSLRRELREAEDMVHYHQDLFSRQYWGESGFNARIKRIEATTGQSPDSIEAAAARLLTQANNLRKGAAR